VKYKELGEKKAFFRSEGDIFVVDMASRRMFRMSGVNLVEISSLEIRLKISLEGAIMDESSAIKFHFSHREPPKAFWASS